YVSLLVDAAPRALHPFPTRRSSDLRDRAPGLFGSFPQLRREGPSSLGTRPERCTAWGFPGRAPILREKLRWLSHLVRAPDGGGLDRKSTRLNSSHVKISYAVFCLKK